MRELKDWITNHVRFDAGGADPVLFPETVTAVRQAEAEALRVVHVTWNSYVQEEARAADGSRTIGPRSWKPAGDRLEAAECPHAVLGVIVVGPGQGTTLPVCLAKDTCTTHWGAEIRARKKAAKARAASGATEESRAAARQETPWERDERLRNQARERFRPALPAITEAFAAAIAKAKATPTSVIGQLLPTSSSASRPILARVPRGKTAEDLLRHLAWVEVAEALGNEYAWDRRLPKLGKTLGVDVAKLVKQHAAAAADSETPAPANGAKAAATSAKGKGTR